MSIILCPLLPQTDPAKRLGNTTIGVQAIKDHPWFTNMDWGHLAAKAYMPPHVPTVKSVDDASCFDKFDNLAPMESGANLAPAQQAWFACF